MGSIVKYNSDFSALKTIEDVLNCPDNSLAKIRKEDDHNTAMGIIIKHLVSFNQFVNVKIKMNNDQIKETAKLIMEDYWALKESDLAYFFKQVKLGRYGQLYESIDGMKILTWLAQYFDERCKLAEDRNLVKHEELKQLEDHRGMSFDWAAAAATAKRIRDRLAS